MPVDTHRPIYYAYSKTQINTTAGEYNIYHNAC